MTPRRYLSLWFLRLAAERLARRGAGEGPLAVVADERGAQVLASVNAEAEAAGLAPGQALRDARAMCPALLTRPADPAGEAAFLMALQRWAGQFSPLVAVEGEAALMLDITGCAHLFGGEAGLMAAAEEGAAALGLSVRAGLADTPGAAWALARFAGRGGAAAAGGARSGDAIAQEARATRSRAGRRHWTRGGPAPAVAGDAPPAGRIAPPGQVRAVLAPLPVAALRLAPEAVAGLARLGLRRIGDLAGLPRAALARRFGPGVLLRLDQALGAVPEPISPVAAAPVLAVRIGFPDPIGLRADLEAALARLLARLAARLEAAGLGARALRLQAFHADGGVSAVAATLARPTAEAGRMQAVLALKLDAIEAGFGIDRLRLEAVAVEPVSARQHRGHLEASADAAARAAADTGLDDLIGRLGARLGMEAVVRLAPADSHIPEKTAQMLTAAFAPAHAGPWPAPPVPRPAILIRPEPLRAPDRPALPDSFGWRGATHVPAAATGPERIAPEWWLDDPEWRSGVRDYWRVETAAGARLWLFYAHGGALSGGWFCHGIFA